ncbi:MAG: transpeptidase family protein [Blastocatellia bacterium]|nr:transpeptidase family protein [Blastocatellia bacterium]MCS7157029.1 transpeptidase family protein [Blastocatellia bacterium]MCX7752230.1 transpeptidase family protein [Blastocatellia bacterium]MDW8256321.1 penicillin-binding protein [Acidobacteriota bacterium]
MIKRELYKKTIRRRLVQLTGLLSVWMLLVGGRLLYVQVAQHEQWRAQADRQQRRTIRVTALRGTIYDRAGRELAKSVEAPSIFAVPAEIEDVDRAARQLARVLRMDPGALRERLSERREFVWVKRKVTPEEATAVKALGLAGIHFVTENKRTYPNGELAAHVLGYAGIDEVGLEGIEFAYDREIRGEESTVFVYRDARGRTYERAQRPVARGHDLILTLDATIQFHVERELREAVRQARARSGVAIVLDPKTGEILALANVPTFDPNAFAKASEEARRNRAIRDLYEPGSVFKIVTFAAALEEGLLRPNEAIECLGGRIVLAGHTIRDHRPFFRLTAREVLEQSSNIGTIQIALRVGAERLAQYIERFGFGRRTGVELPGEARGIVRPVRRWTPASVGAIAIGQEIGVTAIQMAAAMAAIANEGVWVQPHLVRAVRSRDGTVIKRTEPERRRVLSPTSARVLMRMLEGVVERGTGQLAQLSGYSAAGKTGTAQQFDPRTRRYSRTRYVASFAGFAPVADPRVVVLVALDHPRPKYTGGEVAAPVFKRIAEVALHALNVPPDRQPGRPILALRTNFASEGTEGEVGLGVSEAEEAVRFSALPTPSNEARNLLMRNLTPAVAPTQRIRDDPPLVRVPDFRGQGIRAVTEHCARIGLRLIVSGSGRAVRQEPAAGTLVVRGTTCRVEFQ